MKTNITVLSQLVLFLISVLANNLHASSTSEITVNLTIEDQSIVLSPMDPPKDGFTNCFNISLPTGLVNGYLLASAAAVLAYPGAGNPTLCINQTSDLSNVELSDLAFLAFDTGMAELEVQISGDWNNDSTYSIGSVRAGIAREQDNSAAQGNQVAIMVESNGESVSASGIPESDASFVLNTGVSKQISCSPGPDLVCSDLIEILFTTSHGPGDKIIETGSVSVFSGEDAQRVAEALTAKVQEEKKMLEDIVSKTQCPECPPVKPCPGFCLETWQLLLFALVALVLGYSICRLRKS